VILWLISVLIETAALLAYQIRGGFPWFRTLLFFDTVFQILAISAANTSWYRFTHRTAELSCSILTILAVIEAAPLIERPARRAWTAFIIGIVCHAILFEPVWWSSTAGAVWGLVAGTHLMMASWLVLLMLESGVRTAHCLMLTAYCMGVAVCFYLSPFMPMAKPVDVWNSVCWVGFIWLVWNRRGAAGVK